MKTGIVIPYYNGDDCIRDCLKSIMGSTGTETDARVYIVNNSDKETKIHKIAEEFCNTIVIDTKPRIGFARANNIGAELAIYQGAEAIISMNQDTVLDDQCMRELLRPFYLEERIGIVAPMMYSYDFGGIEGFFLKWYISQCPEVLHDTLIGELKDYYRIKTACGACFAIRCEVIKRYGFFDTLYFMYNEDIDLCRKIGYTEYGIVMAPRAKVAHKHSNTHVDGVRLNRIEYWKRGSRVIFMLKDLGHGLFYNVLRVVSYSIVDCARDIVKLKLKECAMSAFSEIKVLASIGQIARNRRREMEIRDARSGIGPVSLNL